MVIFFGTSMFQELMTFELGFRPVGIILMLAASLRTSTGVEAHPRFCYMIIVVVDFIVTIIWRSDDAQHELQSSMTHKHSSRLPHPAGQFGASSGPTRSGIDSSRPFRVVLLLRCPDTTVLTVEGGVDTRGGGRRLTVERGVDTRGGGVDSL